MTQLSTDSEDIRRPSEPPVVATCTRIATNQIGEAGMLAEPLPNVPGSGTWQGETSGTIGTHQRYLYEQIGEDPDVYQQYIVMNDVSGPGFIDGETLIGTPA